MERVRVVNNITKEYPDMYKVVIYHEPHVFVHNDRAKKRDSESVEDYVPTYSSLSRTRTLIKDLILCNDFELFCTFTFDPKKIDSFNYNTVYGAMSRWLHHQQTKSREKNISFFYLIVPEQHKSGRWHFHALISGYTGALKDSGLKTTSLRPIYNITSFRSGYTTAVPVDSREGVAEYVSKYITKEFIQMFNRKRFFCSRGLKRPVKSINSRVFSTTFPLFRRFVSSDNLQSSFIIDKF